MKHPYIGLPDRQFWKREPGVKDPSALDPVAPVPFTITPQQKVVTAGSCFAQHVARFLNASGYNHYITEPAHPVIDPGIAEKFHYGMFSARYGNIYTARQLLQTFHRAYGLFQPVEQGWSSSDAGPFVDPFRPQIHPGGYISYDELAADRAQHFAAIRQAVENLDVFVFTLGLTEAWVDTRDGAVYPLAPGVAGGRYDPDLVRFHNFDEVESHSDLSQALSFLRERNPDCKIILTVSPVPLNATYEDQHVLTATGYSKAVLRLVAHKVSRAFDNCVYFPSYEIITSPHLRGRYFEADCRNVTKQGVAHVMGLFMRHFSDNGASAAPKTTASSQASASHAHLKEMQEAVDLLCDEAALDNK